MANIAGFDATTTPDAPSFEPLPVGQYVCAIVESPMKPSKSNAAHLNINLKWVVMDGKYAKRSFFQNITYENSNATAKAIGRGQLKAICEAVNIPKPTATEQLHNIPVVVSLGLEPRKDHPGEFQNVVKKVLSKKEAWEADQAEQLKKAVTQAPATNASPASMPTEAPAKAPWER